MFFVQLRFAANKAAAPQFMEAHNAWISEGFADGVFLMTGSLAPGIGGAVLAHNTTREALEARVAADPFVGEGIVSAEISEVRPGRVDARLEFLKS